MELIIFQYKSDSILSEAYYDISIVHQEKRLQDR